MTPYEIVLADLMVARANGQSVDGLAALEEIQKRKGVAEQLRADLATEKAAREKAEKDLQNVNGWCIAAKLKIEGLEAALAEAVLILDQFDNQTAYSEGGQP